MPLGKEVGLGPGHIVLDGDPVGTQPATAAPPHFRPMPIVAKLSPISATAELLFKVRVNNINLSSDSISLHVIHMLNSQANVSFTTIFSERELTFTFAICYRPSVCRLSVCL